MRPLICPQCGGQITEYREGATFTTCEYCETRFVIEDNKAPRVPPPVVEPPDLSTSIDVPPFVRVLGISVALVVAFSIVGLLLYTGGRKTTSPARSFFRSASPTPVPSPTPERPILSLGRKGENAGEFTDASAIAVGGHGTIYVGDSTLRVQEFDQSGTFVRMVQVPEKGRNYERARYIDKLAVDEAGRLYIAVGGVILTYSPDWKRVEHTIHVAPDYIQDFALRPDGSMLAVSDDDHIETLLFINKAGGITRRIRGFHTDALRSKISPLATAAESVRIAVGPDGSFYSVYALGALGNYSLSYADDDLRVAKFSPAGKFEKALVQTSNADAIYIDAEGHIILSRDNAVTAYNDDGSPAASIKPVTALTTFTTDGLGNIYTLADNTVAMWRLKQ